MGYDEGDLSSIVSTGHSPHYNNSISISSTNSNHISSNNHHHALPTTSWRNPFESSLNHPFSANNLPQHSISSNYFPFNSSSLYEVSANQQLQHPPPLLHNQENLVDLKHRNLLGEKPFFIPWSSNAVKTMDMAASVLPNYPREGVGSGIGEKRIKYDTSHLLELHPPPNSSCNSSNLVEMVKNSVPKTALANKKPGGDPGCSFPAHKKNEAGKKRKAVQKRSVCVPASGGSGRSTGECLPPDMWAWRKYGQKPIKGSPYPRNYYRCSSSKGCPARKQVERSRTDPTMFIITYTSEHNHPWPTHRNALAGCTRQHSITTTAATTTTSTTTTTVTTLNHQPVCTTSGQHPSAPMNTAAISHSDSACSLPFPPQQDHQQQQKQQDHHHQQQQQQDQQEEEKEMEMLRFSPPNEDLFADFDDVGRVSSFIAGRKAADGHSHDHDDDEEYEEGIREDNCYDPYNLFNWSLPHPHGNPG